MSTSNSPIEKLEAEADRCASELHKQWKAKAFIGKTRIKVGIVQDDKVTTVEIDTAQIGRLSHSHLSGFILKLLKGNKSDG